MRADTGRAPGLAAAKDSLVLALNDVSATLPLVGGKGASLARMARAGFPVPPGFLITTEAYRAFIDANALQASIVALATDAARSGEESSKAIRELFNSATIPPDVLQEIFRAYADLTQASGPMTGARDEIVLDASWGLGEAIVGGLVTPDHIVADKATDAIKEIKIGDKAVMTTLSDTGTVESKVDENKRRAQVLSVSQVSQLCTLGRAIESLYGAPQDIEWCQANATFYIVQARPITALPPAPVPWPSPIPGAKWMKDVQTAEWAKEPPSPLGATTTFAAMVNAREQARTFPPIPKHPKPWSVLINGWLYQRVDRRLPTLIGFMVGIYLCFLFKPLDGHARVKSRWTSRLPALAQLEHIEVNALSDMALRAHSERILDELSWWWMEVTWFAAIGRISGQWLDALHLPGFTDSSALFRGNDSLLLDGERSLRTAAHHPEAVKDYLSQFGHAVESADPIHPTLRESPDTLKAQLAAASRTDVGPDERLAKTQKERQAAEKNRQRTERTARLSRATNGFYRPDARRPHRQCGVPLSTRAGGSACDLSGSGAAAGAGRTSGAGTRRVLSRTR